MPLIGIIGGLGRGKTLKAVQMSYMDYIKGIEIWSDHPIFFPHVKIQRYIDFIDMNNCTALLDELWFNADSYASRSVSAQVISLILARSRKQNIKVIFTEQYLTQIVRRIRRITNIWLYPKTDGVKMPPFEEDSSYNLNYPVSLETIICDGEGREKQNSPEFISDIRPFMKLYDTNSDPYIIDIKIIKKNILELIAKNEKG